MKFGASLRQQSVPQWSHYNVDYDDVKHFIKEKTTDGNGTLPVNIPTQDNTQQLEPQFEDELLNILKEQFQRINLFTKSKYGEIDRRIDHLRRQLLQLKNTDSLRTANTRRYLRLAREVDNVGEEIQRLARYIGTQRMAFRKLLKKYYKWTGSSSLETRFNNETFQRTDAKTFVPAFDETLNRFTEVQALLEDYRIGHDLRKPSTRQNKRHPPKDGRSALIKQSSTQSSTDDPASSVFSASGLGPSSATSVGEAEPANGKTAPTRSKQKSREYTNGKSIAHNSQPMQRYWNEFDDDEEQQDAQYTILVDPDTSFPGAQLFQRMKSLFSRKRESTNNSLDPEDNTRKPLLLPSDELNSPNDDETSSSEGSASMQKQVFGYPPHYQYGSLSRTQSQSKLRRRRKHLTRRARRERNLLLAYISCYITSLALLVTSLLLEAILQPRGHRRTKTRAIHVGAMVGVIGALVLGCVGTGLVARRKEKLGWMHRLASWLVMMVVLAGAVVGIVVIGEAW